MSCGKELTWYELFPIISYLAQGGRCRGCSAYIPSRYLIVELLTGLSFAGIWHLFHGDILTLVFYLILISIFILIVIYDIRHTIIPDELTLGVCVLALFFLFDIFVTTKDVVLIFMHLGAGFCAALFFWGLWFISKGRWIGFGDAKLAFPLGVMVGLGGVFSMVVLSFWIGAGISLILLGIERILKRGKPSLHFLPVPLTIKSEVPFAPFLIAGFLLVQLFGADIFTITYGFLLL